MSAYCRCLTSECSGCGRCEEDVEVCEICGQVLDYDEDEICDRCRERDFCSICGEALGEDEEDICDKCYKEKKK